MSKPTEIYAQLSAGLHRNRKIRKGGRNAREVFVWVLAQVAQRGSQGSIPADDVQDAEYLADELMCSEEEAHAGLADAIRVRLLEIVGGECVVVGWGPEWARRPLTPAERTARYEAKKRNTTESHGLTNTDAAVSDVSAPSGPSVTTSDTSAGLTAPTDNSRTHASQTEEQTEEQKEGRPASGTDATPSGRPPAGKKHRLPDQWQPPDELQEIAREEGVSLRRELAKMRDWSAAEGAKKVDWVATFRGWLRRAGEDRRKARRPPEVDPPANGSLFANSRASPAIKPGAFEVAGPPVNFFTSDEDECPGS